MSSSDVVPPTGTGSAESSSEARRLAVEQLLTQAIRIVERSRPMPFSTSVMINGEELLGILQKAFAALPRGVAGCSVDAQGTRRHAAPYAERGRRHHRGGPARAEQMVQRSEVVKAAEMRARRTVDEAEERARRMKLETEDWCDQRLAAFEAMLHKTATAVSTGRQRLQDTRLPRPAPAPAPAEPDDDIFDQDLG